MVSRSFIGHRFQPGVVLMLPELPTSRLFHESDSSFWNFGKRAYCLM